MKYPSLAKKADKLTYGLLYPAFFGNMVYDLMLPKTESNYFGGEKLATGLLIILYYILDYVHLYGDLDDSVGSRVENKSWLYIGCDAVTSGLFFVSFVLLKYGELDWSIGCIGTVPVFILLYKFKHRLHQTDLWIVCSFTASSLLGLAAYFFWVPVALHTHAYLVFLMIELLYYGGYVLFYYGAALSKQIAASNKKVAEEAEVAAAKALTTSGETSVSDVPAQ